MSLRAFHLFFVAISAALAVFFAAWAAGTYRAEGGVGYAVAAAAGLAGGALLAKYGANFQRKTRHL
jgi:2-hydroxychromene-2-carboxylate isomerase